MLGANQFKEENARLKWTSETNEVNETETDSSSQMQEELNVDMAITLNPMEIRTFVVEIKYRLQ